MESKATAGLIGERPFPWPHGRFRPCGPAR